MFDPNNNYRHVEVRDNRMSYQEPTTMTTSSTTPKNDDHMSCPEPKPSTMSSTAAENDNHMSCQKPKSRTSSSKTATKTIITDLILVVITIIGVVLYSIIAGPPHAQDPKPAQDPRPAQDPKPTQWPDQLHSRIVMNKSGVVELVDFWYDRTNGRSMNIIQRQGGSVLYDLEWNNGTSFHYTVGSHGTCHSESHAELLVIHKIGLVGGILTPDWFDGMSYVGQREVDGSLCNVWEHAEFLTYYEDVVTKRPVHWALYAGREAHVMTFEVGATLEDAKWEVPRYCFWQTNEGELLPIQVVLAI